MKKFFSSLSILVLFMAFSLSQGFAQHYVILAWNDLGMHCCNKDFSKICVLPPYNNLYSQVILQGDANNPPTLMPPNMKVTYEIPGNTISTTKTNFWTYAGQIFGTQLAPNIGLTGKGLTGTMDAQSSYYNAVGIPVTPYTDDNLITENPFQLALVKLFDNSNNFLGSTQNVIPVSNELSCVGNGCHTSEQDILNKHTTEGGFDKTVTPIFCASCHSDNALGTNGVTGVKSLSEAMHGHHAEQTNDCYKCHPGPNTQCFRDTMFSRSFTCQTCHGSVANVASTINAGRKPWLQEPQCGSTTCHGPNFAENTGKLFRQSTGHGGLMCSACHGSPHAIVPTVQPNDNVQNMALQGQTGVLKDCRVCHGVYPTGVGPHGRMAPGASADTIPPEVQSTMADDGTITGTITDKPDDPTIRSNLGMVLFHPADGFNWNFTYGNIVPGTTVSTTFTMTPIDKTKDAMADAAFSDKRGNTVMPTFTYFARDLICEAGKVDFGIVSTNVKTTRTCTISHSTGVLSHTINEISLASGQKGFSVDLSGQPLPLDVLPAGSLDVKIDFTATDPGLYRDTLVLIDAMGKIFNVPMVASTNNAIIQATDINYGPIKKDSSAIIDLTVTNPGTLAFNFIGYKGPHNSDIFMPNLPMVDVNGNFLNTIVINPGDVKKYSVEFKPKDAIQYEDSIILISDAVPGRLKVSLLGLGQNPNDVSDPSLLSAPAIDIVPEPIISGAKVILRNLPNQKFDLVITNERGDMISSCQLENTENIMELSISAAEFNSGVYFINIINRNFNLSKKFRVIR